MVQSRAGGDGSLDVSRVAKSMGRRYIGIDINPAYVKIAQERVSDASGVGKPAKTAGAVPWRAMICWRPAAPIAVVGSSATGSNRRGSIIAARTVRSPPVWREFATGRTAVHPVVAMEGALDTYL